MYKREDFRLGEFSYRFIRLRGPKCTYYLTTEGEIKEWFALCDEIGYPKANRLCSFLSKGDQEEALNKFLEKQNMSGELEQVTKDIKLLEAKRDKIIENNKRKEYRDFDDGRLRVRKRKGVDTCIRFGVSKNYYTTEDNLGSEYNIALLDSVSVSELIVYLQYLVENN